MRIFWSGALLLLLFSVSIAQFSKYKVTDIGLPANAQIPEYLYHGSNTKGGIGTAIIINQSGSPPSSQYVFQNGAFTKVLLPNFNTSKYGYISPSDSGWIAYGPPVPTGIAKAGYVRDGAFHDVPVSGGIYKEIGCTGASETKYMYGFEATGPGPDDSVRPYLYEVDSGIKTFLPILSQTIVTAALDSGVATVSSDFMGFGSYEGAIWKNNQYTYLGHFRPSAISRTEYVAGTDGFSGVHIQTWKNGVLRVAILPTLANVTGVSDTGIISTLMGNLSQAYLVQGENFTKIDDLVVNKPADMTIYGASINYDGHMFGQALVGGQHHFVLLDPVPEPGTWLVVGVGAVVLIRRKARN